MKEQRLVRYPWDYWFAKKRFRLVKGEDFLCASYVMAQQVRNTATRRGVNVSIRIVENVLTVKVF